MYIDNFSCQLCNRFIDIYYYLVVLVLLLFRYLFIVGIYLVTETNVILICFLSNKVLYDVEIGLRLILIMPPLLSPLTCLQSI